MRINMSSVASNESPETVIMRAVLRLGRTLRRRDAAGTLTGAAFSLLASLRRDGPASAVTLARREGLQPQSLSRLLADLERDGMIGRSVDPADRRRHVIAPTRRGVAALDRMLARRREWLADAMTTQLDEAERAALLHAAPLMLRLTAMQEPEGDER